MSEREIEPFGCAVCGRTQTVAMTERGPVKGELERQRIGNFLFCVECLATATESDEDGIHVLTITAGPLNGHRWLTGICLHNGIEDASKCPYAPALP